MKSNKKEILVNYRSSLNLVEKMIHMIERNEPDMNVMKENRSIVRCMKVIHKDLMEDYVKLCFNNGMGAKNKLKKERIKKEILKVVRLYNK